MGWDKVDGYLFRQASNDGNAVLVTDYATDFIFSGRAFTSTFVIEDVTAAGVYILFTADAATTVAIIPPSFTATHGPSIVHYYQGHDYTGGVQQIGYNRNATSVIAPLSTFRVGPTGTTTGLDFAQIVLGTGSQGNTSGGGSYTDNDIFILSPGDTVLIWVEYTDSGSIEYLAVNTTWYEY